MASEHQAQLSLYPRLMGSAWSSVAKCVQDLHFQGDRTHVTGHLEIQAARTALGRFVCAVAGLPRVSGVVPADLVIEGCPNLERWSRTIGQWEFQSVLTEADGFLIERAGAMSFRFVLSVEDRGIRYSQAGASMSVLGANIPLPAFAAPRVDIVERPDSDECSAVLDVVLKVPAFGTILRYVGRIARSSS